MSDHRKITQDELRQIARERFGDDPLDYAFKCPRCGDVATIRDFPAGMRERAGQDCIGRHLGALIGPAGTRGGRGEAERGCDWYAYGLFKGPWEIVMPDGRSAWGFPLADAPMPPTSKTAAPVAEGSTRS